LGGLSRVAAGHGLGIGVWVLGFRFGRGFRVPAALSGGSNGSNGSNGYTHTHIHIHTHTHTHTHKQPGADEAAAGDRVPPVPPPPVAPPDIVTCF